MPSERGLVPVPPPPWPPPPRPRPPPPPPPLVRVLARGGDAQARRERRWRVERHTYPFYSERASRRLQQQQQPGRPAPSRQVRQVRPAAPLRTVRVSVEPLWSAPRPVPSCWRFGRFWSSSWVPCMGAAARAAAHSRRPHAPRGGSRPRPAAAMRMPAAWRAAGRLPIPVALCTLRSPQACERPETRLASSHQVEARPPWHTQPRAPLQPLPSPPRTPSRARAPSRGPSCWRCVSPAALPAAWRAAGRRRRGWCEL